MMQLSMINVLTDYRSFKNYGSLIPKPFPGYSAG